MKHIRITADVDVEMLPLDLANQLGHNKLIDFVKSLDMHVADWDFTTKMFEYFNQEMKKKDLGV